MKSHALLLSSFLISTGFYITAVHAQEVTGTLGSPSATSTIDGQSLPAAPPAFGGTINLDATRLQALVGSDDGAARKARRTSS